tara:strand:- start:789 stop:1094 length:306 start_codon:yes stop_codon:yes gene_type:complete
MLDIKVLYNKIIYEKKTRNEILNYLNECNCCDRHKKNRPYESNLDEEIEIKVIESIYEHIKKKRKVDIKINCNECICQCRHISRQLISDKTLLLYSEDLNN